MLLKNHRTVEVLNYSVETAELPTIKSARLVYIRGENVLTTHAHTVDDAYYGRRYLAQITLNNVPLVQINSPGCPTCSSLLATGYGIENANCRELRCIQEKMNAPFISLDRSIEEIAPLLTLLKGGLYLIADAFCYPTDGNGNFFWDVPNKLTEQPATAPVYLPDMDYTYIEGQPIYVYPTQSTDCYDEKRVNDYTELFQSMENPPRAVAYYFSEFISFILDGHHKACAAAALGKPLNSLLIIPCSGCSYKREADRQIPDILYFSSVKVPVSAVPEKYIPVLSPWSDVPSPVQITSGTIDRRTWETKYTESVKCYPSVLEYAMMTAVGISADNSVSEEQIMNYMKDMNCENQKKMTAVLRVLKIQGDIRLKCIAMRCAREAPSGELKKEAYKLLAQIKADPDIEQLFIDYLVECEDPHDAIRPIVDSYLK